MLCSITRGYFQYSKKKPGVDQTGVHIADTSRNCPEDVHGLCCCHNSRKMNFIFFFFFPETKIQLSIVMVWIYVYWIHSDSIYSTPHIQQYESVEIYTHYILYDMIYIYNIYSTWLCLEILQSPRWGLIKDGSMARAGAPGAPRSPIAISWENFHRRFLETFHSIHSISRISHHISKEFQWCIYIYLYSSYF